LVADHRQYGVHEEDLHGEDHWEDVHLEHHHVAHRKPISSFHSR
jgi:hypothetical protein